MQELIENQLRILREQVMANSDQLTLGGLITKVERVMKGISLEDNPRVVYDFGYMRPSDIASWRGSYQELALNYISDGEIRIREFLEMLKSAIGKHYYGYKGGSYLMDEDTPVWVSNWGESCNTAVVDVIDVGYKIVIVTGYREF